MNPTVNAGNAHRKVMVVDNLDEARQLLGRWLKRQGYRVLEAGSGMEAIEVARREVPDLILMDIKMPGLDGVGAAQSIHSHTGLRDVPIVALSADNTEYTKDRALEAGFIEYLCKPVELDELDEVLSRLMPKVDGHVH